MYLLDDQKVSKMIQQAIATLTTKKNLTQEMAHTVMQQIMSGETTPAQMGAYLMGLRLKGETVAEIAGSAQAMRDQALKVYAPGTVVDTCGTGGDGMGSFNISTTAAFVVAACGLTVAKHGNRSISSKCGSADLLKALGVNIEAPVAVVERCLAEAGIGFLFAPHHHGAMRHAMGVRRELGVRTVFNLLGPLTNPAGASYQVIGVFAPEWLEPLAQVLGRLGSVRALIVHGWDGMDEITLTGSTAVAELHADGSVTTWSLDPTALGLTLTTSAHLQGGDAEKNVAITRAILAGEKGPRQEIVALNAGAALYVTGVATSLQEGFTRAIAALESGRAKERLDQLIYLSNNSPDGSLSL
ncbi:MAG: anthranilate phosphoribosyltransferase [Magnetococcus sp. DMHC-6]